MPDTKTNAPEHPTAAPETLPDFLEAVRNPHTLQLGIIDSNDRPHYDKFCDGIIGCLTPANPLERQLAWTIASDYWRLNRVRNIEDGIFALSQPNPTGEFGSASTEKQIAQSVTHAFLVKQSHFKFLSQYEMRIQRMLNRNKAELKQLQAERHKLETQQSAPHADQPEVRPQPASAANGFECSESPAAPLNPKIEDPTLARAATGQVTVIPFNPASRTGIAANGFAYSKPATTPTGALRMTGLKTALRRAS
ncbi:MAG: hypothetical protein ABJC09_02025 [Terriglobia bacterium]